MADRQRTNSTVLLAGLLDRDRWPQQDRVRTTVTTAASCGALGGALLSGHVWPPRQW
jgi:hypothetical protein